MAVLPLCSKGENKREGAHIKFESTSCNFGAVSRHGEDKRLSLSFVNDGTEPLVLFSATTSCQCLKSEISRKPIAVGERGEIKLTVDVQKMDKGVFHRVVQIRSNSVDGVVVLTIQGVAKD
jgi:hypothetical protein